MRKTLFSSSRGERVEGVTWTLLAACAVSVILIVAWMIHYSSYGFDITDEANAILWMGNPSAHAVSMSQFGYVYEPFYYLLHGDVMRLRSANIVVTLVLGSLLAYSAIGHQFQQRFFVLSAGLVLSVAIGATALASFAFDSATPTYNGLTLHGLLIAGMGFILASNGASFQRRCVGAAVLGIGGWIAFMGKPPAAALLSLLVFVGILLIRPFRWRELLVALMVSAICLFSSAFLIDGSIAGFVDRLGSEAKYQKILGAHSLRHAIRLDPFTAGFVGVLATIVCGVIAMVLSLAANSLSFLASWVVRALAFGVVALAAVSGVADVSWLTGIGLERRMLLLGVVGGALLSVLVLERRSGIVSMERNHAVCWMVLALFPLAYAFATNNNYWWAIGAAAVFWLVAGAAVVAASASRQVAITVLAAMCVVALGLTSSLVSHNRMKPYRQAEPLGAAASTVDVGIGAGKIKVSEDRSAYIRNLRSLSQVSGASSAAGLIDLTGHSPGAAYAIGLTPLGRPWLLGGYPGSDEAAVEYLRRETCEDLGSAWILMEPEGDRRLSAKVVEVFGLDVRRDYVLIGIVRRPIASAGEVVVSQFLYAPVDSRASEARCDNIARAQVTNPVFRKEHR